MANKVTIKVPFKTLTVNHQYFIWRNRKILTKEARKMKEDIANIAKPLEGSFSQKDELRMDIVVHESWYTKKDGSIRKRDVANRQKLMVDGICDGLGIDDSQVFEIIMRKKDSEEEFSIITVTTIL